VSLVSSRCAAKGVAIPRRIPSEAGRRVAPGERPPRTNSPAAAV